MSGCQWRTGICWESDVNNPGNCAGASSTNPALYPTPFVANPGFSSLLGCYDLTRSTPSPADGCASSTSGLYAYHGHTDIKELALYIQDSITIKNWSFNLGLRGDLYNGLVVGSSGRAARRCCLQHQADQYGAPSLLCPYTGKSVQ